MNRAERRAAAKASQWASLSTDLRRLAQLDRVLSVTARKRLMQAAADVDAGIPPLRVLAGIEPILKRVRRFTR
jgi:hypothetical protein